jgi:predicted RNA-binding protein with PUA domain
VDLLGVRRELGELAGDAVVEARADIDQHVAVIHREVGFVGAVHAQHAEELLVRRRERAEPHQRVGDGIARHVHELGE